MPEASFDRDNAEEVALLERGRFPVSVEDQTRWASVNLAYNYWRAWLQFQGVHDCEADAEGPIVGGSLFSRQKWFPW